MKAKLLFLLLCFHAVSVLTAQSKEKEFNTDYSGLAVKGYDLVTYFTAEIPVKGNANHTAILQERTYWFTNKKNKAMFLATPEKYLPQYGGWCAFAMAKGDQVEINPKAYLIQEEKLYLFYKTSWINTRTKWLKEPKAFQAKADLHWNH